MANINKILNKLPPITNHLNKLNLLNISLEKNIKDNIYFVLDQWDKKMSEQLNEEEREQLIKLLSKVCSNINI